MDLSMLFSSTLAIFGLVCLGLLIVTWFGLSRAGKMTKVSRIIFIIMFVLVILFLAITVIGK